MLCCFFCVFKQKTAYEMRISDWSSDVCSSDLPASGRAFSPQLYEWLAANAHAVQGDGPITRSAGTPELFLVTQRSVLHRAYGLAIATPVMGRSEERRVGKECVSTCRSRWWPYQ